MIKIKLDKTDELGVRGVTIKVSGWEDKISGPIRATTSTDSNYVKSLSRAGIKVNYPSQFYESRFKLKPEIIRLLQSSKHKKINEELIKKQTEIRTELPPGEILTMFRPHIPLDPVTGSPLPINDIVQERIRELAILSGYDLIPINDPGINKKIEIYEKRITKERDQIMGASTLTKKWFDCLPTLDCRTLDINTILSRCKSLYDNGFNKINVVCGGLIYARTIESVGNYFGDKDVALIGTNVPKKIGRKKPLSGIHLYQKYGLTTLSPGMSAAFQPKKGKDPHAAIPILDIKRFDRHSSLFLKRGEHNIRYSEDLKCDCPICVGSETLTGFYEKHDRFKGVTKLKSNVHEVMASIKEFQHSRKFIGEMIEYIKTREGIGNYLGIFANQKGLRDFV